MSKSADKTNQLQNEFQTVIRPKNGIFDLHLKELAHYKDLIFLFVRRTFVSQYKQTILGPAWAVIQPLLTTVIFTVVFGNIANLGPGGGIPNFIFYMLGTVAWTYFSGCLSTTATTFTANSNIFGKVYFPRLVLPISTVITQLISFAIQFVFFLVFWVIFLFKDGYSIAPNYLAMLILPLLIVEMAMLALGCGIIISALTTKYRDLAMLVSFGVQLWMYATPVAYSTGIIPEKYMTLYFCNPMTPVIETFRYAFLGSEAGTMNWTMLGVSAIITFVILFIGVVLFSRVEKTFMDTV